MSILLSPGLFIIDHIHFQYNGFLYGILILSIVWARKQSTLLYSGVAFAVLLCLKHIYLYLSLAYFVYLLRAYCLDLKSVFRPRFGNIIKLGLSVVTIFGLAFGPFASWGQLLQLKDRLFPFSRGLCHAYWAPNVWAMYSFTDRVLIPRTCNPTLVLCLADRCSCPETWAPSQLRSSLKCHPRSCRRYIFRCTTRGLQRTHIRSDAPVSISRPPSFKTTVHTILTQFSFP